MDAFRARHGAAWRLDLDPATGRPRRLLGGSLRLIEPGSPLPTDPASVVAAARTFLADNASLLGIDPASLRASRDGEVVSVDHGRLQLLHLDVAPHGVPVVGGHVSLAVSRGNLVYLHVVGAEPVRADPTPAVDASRAIDVALAAASLREPELSESDPPRLVFLREADGHRLAWEMTLHERHAPSRLLARVDARTAALVSLTDQTVEACSPAPTMPARRIMGGVRPERADAVERTELLPFASAGAAVAGRDGVFLTSEHADSGALEGPAARVTCTDCTNPGQPAAAARPDGDVDFGAGGLDETGNALATPADRAAYFHAEGARRLAARWLGVPFVSAPVLVRTNVDSECNAYWDGRGVNFFRSGGGCANTGEIRDVVAHEWGHGLDQNDGVRPPGLDVDGATGEAVADIVAILRSRDPCIGESFHQSGFGPSATCSGVRDADELASGHHFGNPGTISTANAAALCPPSGFYRGPLGREGHCEGEILGQAFWHLVQDLRTGRSYADGSALGSDPLSEDEAWDVAERLFFASRALMASYAPSRLQSIGTSAYDALLVADDEGDGIGNGTPHAAVIHEALAHHGLEESATMPLDAPDCAAPADPLVGVVAQGDPDTGLPSLVVSWTDVGAASHEVLRADDADDAFLLLADVGPGAGTFVDRGVLPGRTYRYRVVSASATGCLSPGALAVSATPGALLRVTSVRVADPPPDGNGDGLLGELEEGDVFVDLRNDGTAAARNLRVTLSASDPALTVVGPASLDYGTIPPGGSVSAPAAFRVRVAAGAPRLVFLFASAESDDGCLRHAVSFEVASRDLRLDATRLEDPAPGGDGDGVWRAGERVTLVVDLRNDGLLDADPVDGTLAFDGPAVPGVTIVDNRAAWGLVPSGGGPVESQPPHFALAAAPAMPPRTRVPLLLTVRIGGDVHRVLPIVLTVGAFPAPRVEWSLTHAAWSTPLVLPLEDGDGDGVITACDTPAVIVLGEDDAGNGGVFAYRGDGSSLLWSFVSADECVADTDPCTLPQYALAGGDIDADGDNEVVVTSTSGHVTALTSTGGVLWTNADAHVSGSTAPQVWDLDGDRTAEIVVDSSVLDGASGRVEWTAPAFGIGRNLVGDLDLDGKQEVVVGWRDGATFRADGTPYPATFPDWEQFGGIVNLDDDPRPEVVYVHGTSVTARHGDGSLAFSRDDLPFPIAPPPPCFGDLDGDGRAEIAFATNDEFYALDDDGTTLWTAPLMDHTGMYASCSVFDFDGDGHPEVVYRDQDRLTIFDGRDGEILWGVAATSSTLWETPVIADVDGDGAAEVLVTYTRLGGFSAPQSLHVFGNDLWLPARAVWNQEAYSVTHVEDDGGITRLPTPRWLAGNDFKGQTSNGPCACAEPSPDFTFTRPDCVGTTACFLADAPGGPWGESSWDFGDGSPAEPGDAPCHEYAAPGDYVVRLTVGAEVDCPRVVGHVVSIRTDLTAPFGAQPLCLGRPTCVASRASGGVPPLELLWDFGDGSAQVAGGVACHDYAAGGTYTITHFVRDAEGCLAESSIDVTIFDPAALPEVSGLPSGPFMRVTRESGAGGGVKLTYEDTGFEVGVYVGDVQRLRIAGYSHEATPACRIRGDSVVLPLPLRDTYYLVVSAACEGPRAEGPYGNDSFGRARPSARMLFLPSCP